jgi:hypothetical protein
MQQVKCNRIVYLSLDSFVKYRKQRPVEFPHLEFFHEEHIKIHEEPHRSENHKQQLRQQNGIVTPSGTRKVELNARPSQEERVGLSIKTIGVQFQLANPAPQRIASIAHELVARHNLRQRCPAEGTLETTASVPFHPAFKAHSLSTFAESLCRQGKAARLPHSFSTCWFWTPS